MVFPPEPSDMMPHIGYPVALSDIDSPDPYTEILSVGKLAHAF